MRHLPIRHYWDVQDGGRAVALGQHELAGADGAPARAGARESAVLRRARVDLEPEAFVLGGVVADRHLLRGRLEGGEVG